MSAESRVYLRGVDLFHLIERYLNNEFTSLAAPLQVIPAAANGSAVVTVKESASQNNKSYQLDIGVGHNFACLGYKICDKDGSYGQLDINQEYNCMCCLMPIKKSPIGIPIKREYRGEKIYYHMVDIFCTFNCVLNELNKRINNSIYTESMTYLSEIYYKSTGRDISEIKPSSDRRLLKIFNGPLTWAEYHSSTCSYTDKPGNMYFLPVIEYIEQTS